MEEANKLIGTGKRHLVMGNAVEAVNVLQEACSMLGKKYGDTADECGEAFFWCGKALLDLARMENSVLGNALEGVPEEDTEDEGKPKDPNIESTEDLDEKTRDELRVQVYDAMAEEEKKTGDAEKSENVEVDSTEGGGKGAKEEIETEQTRDTEDEDKENKAKDSSNGESKEATEKSEDPPKEQAEATEKSEDPPKEQAEATEKSEEPTEKSEEQTEEDEEEEAEGGDDAEMEGDSEEQGEDTAEKDTDDEDVGNLQLAWEMLEVAKVIYKRKETKEDQLMAAQAHLKLGEVSSESGNYAQALEDFQECLTLQLKHLDSNSRLLAETHYQLGLTFGLNCEYAQAIEQFNNSISVIKSRLGKLQEVIDKAEGPEAVPEERKEMEELQTLLPEIQEKVEDATEGLKSANSEAQAVKEALDGGATSSALPASTGQNGDTPISTKLANDVCLSDGSASKGPVSDISHLVRKKRKPDESPVKEGVSKKVKQDEPGTNGTHEPATTDVKNGGGAEHPAKMEIESK